MATIGTETFVEDGIKNYILLNGRNGGEQYLRQLNLPNNWSTLTVGLLCAIQATGSISINSGLSLGIGCSTSGNFGAKNNLTASRTLLQAANGITCTPYGGSAWVYTTTVTGSYLRTNIFMSSPIVSGLRQASSGNGGDSVITTSELPARKSLFMMTITRTTALTASTTVLINVLPSFAGSYNHNYTRSSLLSSLNNFASTTYSDGQQLSSTSTVIGTGSLLTDPLDTVNIYWTGSSPLRIYDVAVAILN